MAHKEPTHADSCVHRFLETNSSSSLDILSESYKFSLPFYFDTLPVGNIGTLTTFNSQRNQMGITWMCGGGIQLPLEMLPDSSVSSPIRAD